MQSPSAGSKKRFSIVLIKPSHYDDDGYVIQWFRSAIPSNTLAVLNGLALDCKQRKVLGDDVEIDIEAIDETNTRIRPDKIARRLSHGRGLVALVGVQSNQYPRALDIARKLRAADVQVCIGGFHVSGVLAMLPGVTPELQEALDLGVSLFAGEAEGRFEAVLKDAFNGALQPLYNYMNDLPSLEGAVLPILPSSKSKAPADLSPASTQAADAPSCAPSAPSLTYKAASRAAARSRTSSKLSARISRKVSIVSSSPTTTSRATRTGKSSSTA